MLFFIRHLLFKISEQNLIDFYQHKQEPHTAYSLKFVFYTALLKKIHCLNYTNEFSTYMTK